MATEPAAGEVPGRPRVPTFHALSNTGFRRYFLGQGISLVGTWLQAAAVRWIVFDRTGSEFLLGVVEVANLMPGLLVGLFAGILADRIAPRSMILLMELVQMVLALTLAALMGLQWLQFWQMVVILALARVCVAFESPSRQVLFYELVGHDLLPNAIALNSGLFNATRVIGPALAGFCLAVLGATACFGLNGFSYLAAIIAIYSIRLPARSRERRPHEPGLRELLAGLSYIRDDPRMLALFLLMVFFGVMGMGYEAMLPAYVRRVTRTGVEGYSVVLACSGLGATMGALTMASLSRLPRKERIVMGGMAVFSGFLAAGALYPAWCPPGWPAPLRVAAAGFCVMGAGYGAVLFYAATQTLIQLAVPHHLRGRVAGVWMIAFSGSVPLGALWTGRAATHWGVTFVMGLSSVVCAAACLLVLVSGRLRSPAEPAGPAITGDSRPPRPAAPATRPRARA
jgi:MFS family permease